MLRALTASPNKQHFYTTIIPNHANKIIFLFFSFHPLVCTTIDNPRKKPITTMPNKSVMLELEWIDFFMQFTHKTKQRWLCCWALHAQRLQKV